MGILLKIRKKFIKFAIERRYKISGPQIKDLQKANLAFTNYQNILSETKIPDNMANKFMGMLSGSLKSFELIYTRYLGVREKINQIHRDDFIYINTHPNNKSRPVHPDENFFNTAIRVDTESLFLTGIIIVRKTLSLIKMFLPDSPPLKTFDDVGPFYEWITTTANLSPIAGRLKDQLGDHFKWLYAVLRFYRNAFIEHMDEPKQQGMNFRFGGESSFTLHSYKWGITAEDRKAVFDFKAILETSGLRLRQGQNPMHYVQVLFDNIKAIPNTHLEEALRLIRKIGINSPEPEELVTNMENYLATLLNFMTDNFSDSNLAQYNRNP